MLETEAVWFQDGFPTGANLGNVGGPLTLVTERNGEVFSSQQALRRTATGLAQDYYSKGAAEIVVPLNGKVFVHCFLDPSDTPEAIMIQFHTSGWKHRVVWGDEAKIPFGKTKTAEKVLMGELPETGQWVRLEVNATKMGLKAGSKITGYAFTQFAGNVTLGVRAQSASRNQ